MFALASRLLHSDLFEALEFSNPVSLCLGNVTWFETVCRIRSPSKTAVGYGVDPSVNTSQLKAYMEAVERWAVSEMEPIASAAHFGTGRASAAAIGELVERDAYIRWAIGLSKPCSREFRGDCVVLQLPSFDSKWVVSMVAKLNMECVPFGLGIAKNYKSSIQHAFGELVLSLQRHQVKKCGEIDFVYDNLHQATRDPVFRNRVLNESVCKHAAGEFSKEVNSLEGAFKMKLIPGIHRWPISVLTASSTKLLKWDLEWFSFPSRNEAHPNSILCNSLSAQLPILIPLG